MIKFHGYHFGRLRPEKIFAELLKGGVIRLGRFEILFARALRRIGPQRA
jgi:hypothetical protein